MKANAKSGKNHTLTGIHLLRTGNLLTGEHLFLILGCPAGFGDIGVGEPSRHDSIDNTEYFYQKKVGIDHITSGAILARSKITQTKFG